MSLVNILLEGRREDFIKKYRGKFNLDQLKKIIDAESKLSNNFKFVDFLGKVISTQNFEENLSDVSELVKEFTRYQENLPEKNINNYESLSQLKDTINTYVNRNRRDFAVSDDAEKVYEDDNIVVVSPKTHAASCYFGSGTKWCTTAESDSQFRSYNNTGKLFYILSKKLPSDNPYYKVALYKSFQNQESFYDAKDINISSAKVIELFGDTWKKIISSVIKYMNDNFPQKVDNLSDVTTEKAIKDAERIQAERIRIAKIMAKQESLRDEDAWGEDSCDDPEAVAARAVFQLLQDEGLVGEDEDIYYLVLEDYKHHGLYYFQWFGESGRYVSYAAGDDYKADRAAIDAIENFIDDNGVEGFRAGFVDDYIDDEAVYEVAYEMYESIINDSPEDYLGSDKRNPSPKQEQFLEFYNKKLEVLRKKLENASTEEESDEISDEIYEVESEIEDINNDPQGDFNQEDIDDLVEAYARDEVRNPKDFLEEHGLSVENYLDKGSLIKGIIESDGRGGFLNYYDSEEYEERVCDEWIFIYRVD